MMKIHKEGYSTLRLIFFILFLTGLLIYMIVGWIVLCVYIVLSVLFLPLVALFFRTPERVVNSKNESIVSPADGKVIIIEKTFENEFLEQEMLKISIFMSVWNVHLNRVPLTGKVIYQKYHPGKYLVAFHEKSSELNERNTVVIEDEKGRKFLVRQIAGAVARRIRCYTPEGLSVSKGDELGFIKFGSRVDLFVPLDTEINVKINDKVQGNSSIIGVLK